MILLRIFVFWRKLLTRTKPITVNMQVQPAIMQGIIMKIKNPFDT